MPKKPIRKLTEEQRERYDRTLRRCLGEVTALEMMLAEYAPADEATDDGAISELEDLAARIGALTACWTPAGVEPKYVAGGEGNRTGGDYSHSG